MKGKKKRCTIINKLKFRILYLEDMCESIYIFIYISTISSNCHLIFTSLFIIILSRVVHFQTRYFYTFFSEFLSHLQCVYRTAPRSNSSGQAMCKSIDYVPSVNRESNPKLKHSRVLCPFRAGKFIGEMGSYLTHRSGGRGGCGGKTSVLLTRAQSSDLFAVP